jgi:hypothetical protein
MHFPTIFVRVFFQQLKVAHLRVVTYCLISLSKISNHIQSNARVLKFSAGVPPYVMGTVCPFPGSKARPGRDADHSPSSSAEIVNE